MDKKILSIFSRKKTVGLYIGQETVDLVVLQGTLQGPKLIKFGQVPIYPNDTIKTEIISPSSTSPASASVESPPKEKTRDDYIVEAIQRIIKENNIIQTNVITAISTEEAMVRYFQMPKMPKSEWDSAINFEAKRYIPFRMEDVTSDFQAIQNKVSPNTMDVVFVAARKTAVEEFIALVEKAGIKPTLIEPSSFSLIRAFSVAEQISNKVNTAVVNIESKRACINILRSGVPYLIRNIPLEEEGAKGALEPIFEKLLGEIKLSFDFYEKQFPSEVIDKIIIYSHVPLENWHEIVGKELQVPVEMGDPLRGIKIKKDIVPPRLAVSFGLALRGLVEPVIDVNFYKEQLIASKSKELFTKIVLLEASVSVFLLVILKVICMKAIAPLGNELNRAISERPREGINVQTDDIEKLERIKNEMEAKRKLLEAIITARTYITPRLAAFTKLIPSNIWLYEVLFEEKVDKTQPTKMSRQLKIKGYCVIDEFSNEADTVNNFLAVLQDNEDIKNGMSEANINSVERTEKYEEQVANFEIIFR